MKKFAFLFLFFAGCNNQSYWLEQYHHHVQRESEIAKLYAYGKLSLEGEQALLLSEKEMEIMYLQFILNRR